MKTFLTWEAMVYITFKIGSKLETNMICFEKVFSSCILFTLISNFELPWSKYLLNDSVKCYSILLNVDTGIPDGKASCRGLNEDKQECQSVARDSGSPFKLVLQTQPICYHTTFPLESLNPHSVQPFWTFFSTANTA